MRDYRKVYYGPGPHLRGAEFSGTRRIAGFASIARQFMATNLRLHAE